MLEEKGQIVSNLIRYGFAQKELTDIMTRKDRGIFYLKLSILEVRYSWGRIHLCLFLILRNKLS